MAASQLVRSLGVNFDEDMSFHARVSSICRSSFYHFRNLSRIRKYFTKESAEVAVHAFVTSKLDYCNALLYGLPKYQLQKLRYVQNTAARVVLRVSKFHTRSLRSVSNELLMQPRSYTKTYGASAVYAPREWNLIPNEIRKSNTISSFKRLLKTSLFTKLKF